MLLDGVVVEVGQISGQLQQLFDMVNMIKCIKTDNLIDLLKKADCSFKAQWKDCISSEDVSQVSNSHKILF